MDEIAKLKKELGRSKAELNILFEISNSMRTTLQLDEILYIILTGTTAHTGLAFNRSVLFLVNQYDKIIEGKMAIGPENGEEANLVWNKIKQEKMDFEDLISAYKTSSHKLNTGLNHLVKQIKIPLTEHAGGLLALSALDGMPLHLTADTIKNYANDTTIKLLNTEELAIVPLKAKDIVNGIILADNPITKKPISKDDIRMLTMLANQAGLAIENSQLYEKTLIHAHTDSITGLWNHGYFQKLLLTEVCKAQVAGAGPLSLVLIDIDNFKSYNDTFGHQSGDKILSELSQLLKILAQKRDQVCRYGGEEFAIIMPQTDKKEAYSVAECIRSAVEKHVFSNKEFQPDKKLSISLGIAAFPDDGSNPSEMISHSDKALYRAKNSGKNKTCG